MLEVCQEKNVSRHDQLVEIARRSLKSTGHDVVLTEARGGNSGERPDAIGWEIGGASTLVECKVSRKDYLDEWRRRKPFRGLGGVGNRRYYMAFVGVLRPEDVVNGWGLVLVYPRARFRCVKTSAWFEADQENEKRILLGSMRSRREEIGQIPLFTTR